MEFIGGFESTYLPAHDVDILEMSGHTERWRADLRLVRESGISRLRYPIRWHRIEADRGVYDWAATDEVLGYMRDEGLDPIVDVLHHTSYPRWLSRGFADDRFEDAYLTFCEAFASRYPWIGAYTLFNEPFPTLYLAGHEGTWPPYGIGMRSFVELLRNVVPALARASRMYADLLPAAQHVFVEPCEGHSGPLSEIDGYAAMANERRFFILDAVTGRAPDADGPFVRRVIDAGGEDLLGIDPGRVDVLALDYYAHTEWSFGPATAMCPSATPLGLAALVVEYWQRYDLPLMLGETNIRGRATDRASWLKYTLEQCDIAREAGAPLEGYCWFPFIDSLDWDSLLANADRHIDPVGVYWLDEELERRSSVMSHCFKLAVSGTPAADLPAFRFTPPLDAWLKGLLPQMSHWDWQDPPCDEVGMCPTTVRIHANWREILDDVLV